MLLLADVNSKRVCLAFLGFVLPLAILVSPLISHQRHIAPPLPDTSHTAQTSAPVHVPVQSSALSPILPVSSQHVASSRLPVPFLASRKSRSLPQPVTSGVAPKFQTSDFLRVTTSENSKPPTLQFLNPGQVSFTEVCGLNVAQLTADAAELTRNHSVNGPPQPHVQFPYDQIVLTPPHKHWLPRTTPRRVLAPASDYPGLRAPPRTAVQVPVGEMWGVPAGAPPSRMTRWSSTEICATELFRTGTSPIPGQPVFHRHPSRMGHEAPRDTLFGPHVVADRPLPPLPLCPRPIWRKANISLGRLPSRLTALIDGALGRTIQWVNDNADSDITFPTCSGVVFITFGDNNAHNKGFFAHWRQRHLTMGVPWVAAVPSAETKALLVADGYPDPLVYVDRLIQQVNPETVRDPGNVRGRGFMTRMMMKTLLWARLARLGFEMAFIELDITITDARLLPLFAMPMPVEASAAFSGMCSVGNALSMTFPGSFYGFVDWGLQHVPMTGILRFRPDKYTMYMMEVLFLQTMANVHLKLGPQIEQSIANTVSNAFHDNPNIDSINHTTRAKFFYHFLKTSDVYAVCSPEDQGVAVCAEPVNVLARDALTRTLRPLLGWILHGGHRLSVVKKRSATASAFLVWHLTHIPESDGKRGRMIAGEVWGTPFTHPPQNCT